jgi:hypothetical protein
MWSAKSFDLNLFHFCCCCLYQLAGMEIDSEQQEVASEGGSGAASALPSEKLEAVPAVGAKRKRMQAGRDSLFPMVNNQGFDAEDKEPSDDEDKEQSSQEKPAAAPGQAAKPKGKAVPKSAGAGKSQKSAAKPPKSKKQKKDTAPEAQDSKHAGGTVGRKKADWDG